MVELALKGQTENLKERTIGIDVFERNPDYDTNIDHVVRTTAGEIRKRIAQYYHEPGPRIRTAYFFALRVVRAGIPMAFPTDRNPKSR